MTRKGVGRDHREYPTSETARWPAGNSDKIYMRLSQHSTERCVPVINNGKKFRNQSTTPWEREEEGNAYKSDFLVQPEHPSQGKNSKC
jgi:hypothetical protein